MLGSLIMQCKYLLLVYLSHGWDSGLLITVFPEKAEGGLVSLNLNRLIL